MERVCTLPDDFGCTPRRGLHVPADLRGLVVHCCCAPCAGAVFECLAAHDLHPLVFFFNPNIHPRSEYLRRRDELLALCRVLGFEVEVGDYEPRAWLEAVAGLEHEPERGARCQVCFTYRLTATALLARERGATHFTSTLATSRWKDRRQVDAAGAAAALSTGGAVSYWDEDWRKGGLSERRSQLVRSCGFYNQHYCGCIYSLRSEGRGGADRACTADRSTPSGSTNTDASLSAGIP